MVPLTNTQQIFLQQLFTEAMMQSAGSFSRLLGVEVASEPIQMFQSRSEARIYPCFKTTADLIMLVTPLMGEIAGRSYLIFDATDIDGLKNQKQIKSFFLGDDVMKEALLKEIDNILSASFISVISNRLGISMFGDVPEWHKLSSATANEAINSYHPNGPLSLIFQSSFLMRAFPRFNPQFIWKVSGELLKRSVPEMQRHISN